MIHTLDLISREQIHRLRRLSAWRTWLALLTSWGLMALGFALFIRYPHWLVFVLAVVVIGRTQFSLAVLMHEGAHRLLFRSRALNDLIAQWLCAYPVMLDAEPYRDYHLQHHAHTQREQDPDLVLSRAYPVTRSSFVRKMLRDITGIAGLRRYYGTLRSVAGTAQQPWWQRIWSALTKLRGFLLTNTMIVLTLAFAGHPELYVLLWWVPMLTCYSLIYRIRNLGEHGVVGEDCEDDFRNTRTTVSNPLVRWLMAPLNVNFHLEHHLMPHCPWYNLPRLHRALKDAGFGDRMLIDTGYFKVLRQAIV